MNNKSNSIIIRISLITLLTVIIFGILHYIPQDKKYDILIPEAGLKVIASSIFSISLIFFVFYIIGLFLEFGYKSKFKFPFEFFYDIGVAITTFIIVWTVFLYIGINFLGNTKYILKGYTIITLALSMHYIVTSNLQYYLNKANMGVWGPILLKKVKLIKGKSKKSFNTKCKLDKIGEGRKNNGNRLNKI